MFALEELKKGFGSSLTASVLTSVLGGTAGYVLTGRLWNAERFVIRTDIATIPIDLVWTLLIAAAVAGLAAALFVKLLEVLHSAGGLRRVPTAVRLTAVFVISAVAAVFAADSFGGGTLVLKGLLSSVFTWQTVLTLLALKIFLTAAGFYSKATGGLLIPSLALGALIGEAVRLAFSFMGVGAEYTTLFAVVCMAAFLGAAFGTPMSAAVLALELTGAGAEAFIYVAAGVFVAFVTAELMKRNPLYEFMLASDAARTLK